MTGADSPVIGALVDRRDALDDLAVDGDELPRVDDDDVALAEVNDAGTSLSRPVLVGAAAGASRGLPAPARSASAWALPRPSAIASAKFAKSTVNHSHKRDLRA
jgi:hypothetical protein